MGKMHPEKPSYLLLGCCVRGLSQNTFWRAAAVKSCALVETSRCICVALQLTCEVLGKKEPLNGCWGYEFNAVTWKSTLTQAVKLYWQVWVNRTISSWENEVCKRKVTGSCSQRSQGQPSPPSTGPRHPGYKQDHRMNLALIMCRWTKEQRLTEDTNKKEPDLKEEKKLWVFLGMCLKLHWDLLSLIKYMQVDFLEAC